MASIQIKTDVYQITDNIDVVRLDDDYKDLCVMLRLEPYYELTDPENYLLDLDEYPVPQTLNEKVLNKVESFYNNIYGVSSNLNYQPTVETLETLVKGKNLLAEQLIYLTDNDDSSCTKWQIISTLNNELYGSTFVFYNPSKSPDILLQGISRSFIPILIESVVPGTLSSLPRLNSIIQPAVETIGLSVGAKQIMVAPIGRQGKILEKHYGYRKVPNIIFPCDDILGSSNISNNPEYHNLYAKQL